MVGNKGVESVYCPECNCLMDEISWDSWICEDCGIEADIDEDGNVTFDDMEQSEEDEWYDAVSARTEGYQKDPKPDLEDEIMG